MAVAHATYTPQSTWSSTEKHHATEKEIAKSNQQSPASSISSRSSTRSSEYISGNDNTKVKQDVKSSKLHLGLVGKKLFQNNAKPATTESSHNVQSTHKVAAVPKSPASSVKSSTSLLKKYGTCDKRSCIGRGATAVVRLVHKMDRKDSSDKLYAVKEFRKRRKNESEKEYMKKLTGEFCISSTFQHPNVVETVDLVLDEQQRYCTVMEYVSVAVLSTTLPDPPSFATDCEPICFLP
jgi:hypothetical protein